MDRRILIAMVFLTASIPVWPQTPPVIYSAKDPINKFIPFGRAFFKHHRGSVLRHWMEKFTNPNSKQEGELHTELHRGYRFEFIREDRYTKDEVAQVLITDPTILLPLGVSLGDSKERVQKIIGPPHVTKEDSLEYELSFDMCFLTFRFRRSRLVEVEISYDHE